MKIKLFVMLTFGGLLASISDILMLKPDIVKYFNNDPGLYAISCANRDCSKSFKTHVDECKQHLKDELPKIQQELFERFKEYVLAHLSDEDLDFYLSKRFKDPSDCARVRAYLNQFDSDHVLSFFAIRARVKHALGMSSGIAYPKNFANAVIDFSDLLFWLRLFTQTLAIKHRNYKVNKSWSEHLHKILAPHRVKIDNTSPHICPELKNQFSICQLRSPLLPYFGLIVHPEHQNNIWGFMKFDVYSIGLKPTFLEYYVHRNDHNNLIKLIAMNFITTAPDFIKYFDSVYKIHSDQHGLYFPSKMFYDSFIKCSVGFSERHLYILRSRATKATDPLRYSMSCVQDDCDRHMKKISSKIPLLFAPIYRFNPVTKEPEDLPAILDGKISGIVD